MGKTNMPQKPKTIYREARLASSAWNLFKSVSQMAVFWTIFLFVLPALFYFVESSVGWKSWRFDGPSFRIVGTVIFLLASSLGVSSCVVMALIGRGTPLPFDCARRVVVVGPYRYIRNPMALAGLIQGVAVGLFFGSPLQQGRR
jgi:protein-S-isoprenylcysteine O-methyltransferase Ste14